MLVTQITTQKYWKITLNINLSVYIKICPYYAISYKSILREIKLFML